MATRNHNKPWTKADIAELRKSYHKLLHRELATKLGRTLNSVESKATEIGITQKKK